MRGEVGKETPKKEMDIPHFRCSFMTSHMTLSRSYKDDEYLQNVWETDLPRPETCKTE